MTQRKDIKKTLERITAVKLDRMEKFLAGGSLIGAIIANYETFKNNTMDSLASWYNIGYQNNSQLGNTAAVIGITLAVSALTYRLGRIKEKPYP